MLPILSCVMPRSLHRTFGADHLHLLPAPAIGDCLFCVPRSRDRLLTILKQTRQRYR